MVTKVLIIRFSSIGDIVLTTPVIRCLKQQLDGANEVHFLTKKHFVPLIEENPYIDHIHAMESDVAEVIPQLKKEEFHYVIDLHNNIRSLRVKRALKTLSFSFNKLNIQKWFYVNTKIDIMPNVHIVERYLEAAKPLGIKNDHKGLDYFIPSEDQVDIATLPAFLKDGFIGFVIGGSYPGKVLPEHKIAEVCKKLKTPVVLLGGPEDKQVGEAIENAFPNQVYNACGSFSINQSASLVQQAKVVISHDTGLMHIASAFKKKIISIWGATVPQFGMHPYLPGEGSQIIEPKGVWDRPYSKLGNNKFYKPKFKGMEKINTDEIVAAVNG